MSCSWPGCLASRSVAASGWAGSGIAGGRGRGGRRMARWRARSVTWGRFRWRGAGQSGGSRGAVGSVTGPGCSSWCRRGGCTGSSRWRSGRCCWRWTSPGPWRRSCRSRSGSGSKPPPGRAPVEPAGTGRLDPVDIVPPGPGPRRPGHRIRHRPRWHPRAVRGRRHGPPGRGLRLRAGPPACGRVRDQARFRAGTRV
jgi:hypothetical protein